MVAVVRMPSVVRRAMHRFPFVRFALQPRNAVAHFVVQNFSAAAGNGNEAGIAQARDRVAQRQSGNFRDAGDFRRRKAVQVNLREALADRPQHIFVVVDFQIRMQTAL